MGGGYAKRFIFFAHPSLVDYILDVIHCDTPSERLSLSELLILAAKRGEDRCTCATLHLFYGEATPYILSSLRRNASISNLVRWYFVRWEWTKSEGEGGLAEPLLSLLQRDKSPPIRVPSVGDKYPNVVGRTTRFKAEIGFLMRFFWLTRWLPRRSGHGGCLADPVRVLFNIYTRLQHFLGGTPPCPSTNPFITPSQCSCCVRRYQH